MRVCRVCNGNFVISRNWTESRGGGGGGGSWRAAVSAAARIVSAETIRRGNSLLSLRNFVSLINVIRIAQGAVVNARAAGSYSYSAINEDWYVARARAREERERSEMPRPLITTT